MHTSVERFRVSEGPGAPTWFLARKFDSAFQSRRKEVPASSGQDYNGERIVIYLKCFKSTGLVFCNSILLNWLLVVPQMSKVLPSFSVATSLSLQGQDCKSARSLLFSHHLMEWTLHAVIQARPFENISQPGETNKQNNQ